MQERYNGMVLIRLQGSKFQVARHTYPASIFKLDNLQPTQCEVMKLAAMPACLAGGGSETNLKPMLRKELTSSEQRFSG